MHVGALALSRKAPGWSYEELPISTVMIGRTVVDISAGLGCWCRSSFDRDQPLPDVARALGQTEAVLAPAASLDVVRSFNLTHATTVLSIGSAIGLFALSCVTGMAGSFLMTLAIRRRDPPPSDSDEGSAM